MKNKKLLKKIDKTLIRKIRLAYTYDWSQSEIARYFSISRDTVMYWLGRLKYKPKELRGDSVAAKKLLSRKSQLEFAEEKKADAIQEKKRINNLIITGRLDTEKPVEIAYELRKKFYRRYDVMPEEL